MRRFAWTTVTLVAAGGRLGLIGCVPPLPPGNTVRVTTTVDAVADDGATSLREAFAVANANDLHDTIVLAAGATYDLTRCDDGALAHTTVDRVAVAGNGATVHQTCAGAGILRSVLPASSLVLRGLTLVGGPGSGTNRAGAGIDVRGSLFLDTEVTVTGVDAGPGGTVIEGNAGGPAADDVRLESSSVVGNTGTAVRIRDGAVHLDRSVVSGNTGDGVRLDGTSTLVAAGAAIADNDGWGVNAQGVGYSRLDIDTTQVDRNGRGGITCRGCEAVDVIDAAVRDNGGSALAGSGGGIETLAVIDDAADSPSVLLERTTVSGNRAQRAGGGLFAGSAVSTAPDARPDRVVLVDTTIAGNATSGDHQPGGGAAVTTGDLEVYNAVIAHNTAGGSTGSDGGGLYFGEPPNDRITIPYWILVTSSTVTGNRTPGRGGGVFVETEEGSALNGTFSANVAGGSGGGVFVSSRTGRSFRSHASGEYLDNTSGGVGGGAAVTGEVVVERAEFRRNHGTEGGGVHFASPGPRVDAAVDRSTFDANTASVRGGGIATTDAVRLTLANATVNANSAPRGGGLSIGTDPLQEPETLSLTHVTLADNAAPSGAHVEGYGRVETFASLLVLPQGGGTACRLDPVDQAPLGYSFAADTSCGTHPTDTISAADPLLAPLAGDEPGGLVRRPATTSPIGGTVPVDACTIAGDQQFQDRPQGAACEPGSVEIVEATAEEHAP